MGLRLKFDVGQHMYLQNFSKRDYTEEQIGILTTAICQFLIYNEEAGGLYRCFYSSEKNAGIMLAARPNRLFKNGKVVRVTPGSFDEVKNEYTRFNKINLVQNNECLHPQESE